MQPNFELSDEGKEAAPPPLFGPVLGLDEAKGPPVSSPAQVDSSITPAFSPESQISSSPQDVTTPISQISSSPEALTAQGKDASTPNSQISSSSETLIARGRDASMPISQISSSPEAVIAQGRDASTPKSQISLSPEALPPDARTPVPNPNSGGPSGFIDQDIALAIEARIRQSQTDSQVAMDEAKKLLEDPNIASSETGKCLSKCVDKYADSLDELSRAVTDLGVRNVRLLADDFGAVETDISSCQACFTDKTGEDSPFRALEEATTPRMLNGYGLLCRLTFSFPFPFPFPFHV